MSVAESESVEDVEDQEVAEDAESGSSGVPEVSPDFQRQSEALAEERQKAGVTAEQLMQLALCRGAMLWDFFGHLLSSMPRVQARLPATTGVDRYAVLYYDPQRVIRQPLGLLIFAVLHEASHVFLRHAARGESLLGDRLEQEHLLWNVACDFPINVSTLDALRSKVTALPGLLDAVGTLCFPAGFELPDGLVAEEYYSLLKQKQAAHSACCCGSGATGVAAPWELPGAPGDPIASGDGNLRPRPGLDEGVLDDIVRETARRILENHRSAGTAPGHLVRAAEAILSPPVNVARLLRFAVRRLISQGSSQGRRTFQRYNRRMPPAEDGLVFPVKNHTSLRIGVCLDTSGSMDERTDIALALGAVRDVLAAHPPGAVRVFTGDVGCQAAQQVFKAEQVQLFGGGGTDVGRILQDALSLWKADVLVAITDGYTPWPETPLPVPVLACITQQDSAAPPSWLRVVEFWRGKESRP